MAYSYPDRFEILELVASSDAEEVVRARDCLLGREVFLKRVGPAIVGRARVDRDKRLREARVLARVQHPGVVRLLDALEFEDSVVLVLEPIAGETLAEQLARSGRLDAADVKRLGIALCDALDAVHQVGALHRGLSTANVIVRPDGSPCLVGFTFVRTGSAVSTIDSRVRCVERAPAGLPLPAPEQRRGEPLDARADLYGLGCVLLECLTGAALPETGLLGDVRVLVPDAPRALSAVLQRCLAQSPVARYPTARAVRAALAQTGEAVPVRGAPGRWLAWAAASLVLAIVATSWLRPGATPSAGGGGTSGGLTPLTKRYQERYSRLRSVLVGIRDPAGGLGELPKAADDVAALASVLQALPGSWDVKCLTNAQATRANIEAELRRLRDDSSDDDCVLFYFAGHGEKLSHGWTGWLVPADAPLDKKSDEGCIPFDSIRTFLRSAKAKHVLVVLDCCYAGVAMRGPPEAPSAQTLSTKYLVGASRLLLTSGGAERVPDDSPFAAALLEVLSDRSREAVTAHQVHARVQSKLDSGGHKQKPMLEDVAEIEPAQRGEFVFFLRGDPRK